MISLERTNPNCEMKLSPLVNFSKSNCDEIVMSLEMHVSDEDHMEIAAQAVRTSPRRMQII